MPLRCLLDANMDPKVARILTLLEQPATHVFDIDLGAATDSQILEAARDFDVLVTLDLFRQSEEWRAAKQAVLDSVRIIRIRFGASQPDHALAQSRALLWRWTEIETRMNAQPQVRLATLSGNHAQARFTTEDDLRDMRGPRPGL